MNPKISADHLKKRAIVYILRIPGHVNSDSGVM